MGVDEGPRCAGALFPAIIAIMALMCLNVACQRLGRGARGIGDLGNRRFGDSGVQDKGIQGIWDSRIRDSGDPGDPGD